MSRRRTRDTAPLASVIAILFAVILLVLGLTALSLLVPGVALVTAKLPLVPVALLAVTPLVLARLIRAR